MDTILYFYKKRRLARPETEPVGLKAYLLIRIGLDVEEGRWFDKRLEESPAGGQTGKIAESAGAAAGAGAVQGKGKVRESGGDRTVPHMPRSPWKAFRQRRMERKRRQEEQIQQYARQQEESRRLAARAQMLEEVEASMERLASEVAELAGDMDRCSCVYEDNIRKALAGAGLYGRDSGWRAQEESDRESRGDIRYGEDDPGRGQRIPKEIRQTGQMQTDCGERAADIGLPGLWQKHFPLKEFHDYTNQFWVEQLFRRATLPHFIILGTAEGIFPIIEAYAARMKSLRWILTEAEYDQDLADFVEDFYTEYGLAIELELLEDVAALKRLRLFCKEAVNMVDFTGEAYMAAQAVPEGSIWLDMFSVEEKKRRILARDKKVAYISMKELWKIAQKRCNCPVLP